MVDAPMDAFEQPQTAEETDVTGVPGDMIAAHRTRRATGSTSRPSQGTGDVARPARDNGAPHMPLPDRPTPGGRIADAIEAALLPRLVMLHGGREAAFPDRDDAAPDAAVAAFTASLTANDDAMSAMALLQQMRADGSSFETLCLALMAPAARRLGAMWETDECDFALVTLGLSRLQRLMHEMDAQIAAAVVPVDPGRVAILAVAPGEQHVFGIAMVGDFLRRAGWEVHDAVGASSAEIADAVRHTWFSVAALSCSSEAGLESLAGRVTTLRARSRNRAVGILVGGRVFDGHPEAAIRIGADATAQDAWAAVWQAERLLANARVFVPAG